MSDSENTFIKGILLLYHHPLETDAATVMENVNAFDYSKFNVWKVNTAFGFPPSLNDAQFEIVVLHYSIFGNWPYAISQPFLDYVASCRSYKIAFFQDEHHYCRERFEFLNRYAVNCVYTLVEPQHFKDVYLKYTSVATLVNYIPGYVADDLVAAAAKMYVPEDRRTTDVGYRGRPLPFYMGEGAQEKTRIGVQFRQCANDSGLRLDIETDEGQRIYGKQWHKFIANCRSMLGVEAGVSIFDLDGQARKEVQQVLADNPSIDFTEISEKVLSRWEGNLYYRTISPRHFEAAAFRVCQILFEGRYSGIMKPLVHYIPLKKDFSNFDECVRMFQDKSIREEITDNAYNDLIESGRYSYRSFMTSFDKVLAEAGLAPSRFSTRAESVLRQISRDTRWLELHSKKNNLIYSDFPGRRPLAALGGPVLRALRKLKRDIA